MAIPPAPDKKHGVGDTAYAVMREPCDRRVQPMLGALTKNQRENHPTI
jgi:hypothetical protein